MVGHIWIHRVCCYGQQEVFSSHTNLLNLSCPLCLCYEFKFTRQSKKKSEVFVKTTRKTRQKLLKQFSKANIFKQIKSVDR